MEALFSEWEERPQPVPAPERALPAQRARRSSGPRRPDPPGRRRGVAGGGARDRRALRSDAPPRARPDRLRPVVRRHRPCPRAGVASARRRRLATDRRRPLGRRRHPAGGRRARPGRDRQGHGRRRVARAARAPRSRGGARERRRRPRRPRPTSGRQGLERARRRRSEWPGRPARPGRARDVRDRPGDAGRRATSRAIISSTRARATRGDRAPRGHRRRRDLPGRRGRRDRRLRRRAATRAGSPRAPRARRDARRRVGHADRASAAGPRTTSRTPHEQLERGDVGHGTRGWADRVRAADGIRRPRARPTEPLAVEPLAAPRHERAAWLRVAARARLHRSPRRRCRGRPVHPLRTRRGAGPLRVALPAGMDEPRHRLALPPPRGVGQLAACAGG